MLRLEIVQKQQITSYDIPDFITTMFGDLEDHISVHNRATLGRLSNDSGNKDTILRQIRETFPFEYPEKLVAILYDSNNEEVCRISFSKLVYSISRYAGNVNYNERLVFASEVQI